MTALARVRIGLTGWSGAPGVNTLYFSPGTAGSWSSTNVDDLVSEVDDMVVACLGAWLGGVVVTVDPEVAIMEPTTGEVTEVIVASDPPDSHTSSASATGVSRATQALVALKTGVWHNGRQLQGRLFLGPLAGGQIISSGLINPDLVADIDDAFVAMTSGLGSRLAVWSRPKAGSPASGFYEDVTLAKCSSLPAVLRSRRD